MWKSLGLLVLLLNCTTTKLFFDTKVVVNPKIYANFKINITNGELFNMTMDIMRKLESKIMWKFEFYRLAPNKVRQRYLSAPKVNFCNMRRGANFVPFLSGLLQHLNSYGNWTKGCPYKPGFYGIWNLVLDANVLPMKRIIPKGRYEAYSYVSDENYKPEMMMKFSLFVEVT